MHKPACWSNLGRGGELIVAAALLTSLGGCSSGVTRFDYPAFNLTNSSSPPATSSEHTAYADPDTTSAIPVPQESIYSSGSHYGSSSGVTRTSLPPIGGSYSTPPRAMPASYSPAPPPRSIPATYSPSPMSQPLRPQRTAAAGEGTGKPETAISHSQAAPGRKVKVENGDTLASLARRYGSSVETIQSANHLGDTRLHLGQELIIPASAVASATPRSEPVKASAPSTYKVQKGDTPHLIAERLHVDEKELLAANNLQANRLRIGQELHVPGRGTHEAPEPHEAPEAPEAPVLAANPTPTVGQGEPKPVVPVADSGDAPAVRSVHTTTISGAGSQAAISPPSHAQAAAAPSKEKSGGTAVPVAAASADTTGGDGSKNDGDAASSRISSVDQLPNPDPMSGNTFRWPVQGRIISEFGTKPDGGHNDGIDVAVPQGTPVKAAENGVVAYAGDELKGYGNLVLIRHANNWVSAYAHNDELLVKRGDKVRRGQVIAKAGKSGTVNQPQLHFELRKGSRPVDPTKYMSAVSASAD